MRFDPIDVEKDSNLIEHFFAQLGFSTNITIDRAVTTRNRATISLIPTDSFKISVLLKTPTTGMARVLMAAILAGNIRTSVKYAQWQ